MFAKISGRIVLSCIVFFQGCAGTAPYVRPVPPIPQQWPATKQASSAKEASSTHWRSFFVDPRLQALITAGLENNRDLRIAAARVSEARAQYDLAKADRFPMITAMGSGTFTGTTSDITGTGAPLSTSRIDAAISSTTYEVDFWGRLGKLSEAARNSLLATQEAQRAVHITLVSEIARTYFALLQLREVSEFAKNTIQLREQSLAILGKGRDMGASNDFDYQQSVGILESSKATLYAITQQIYATTNQLNFLIGNSSPELPEGKPLSEQGLDQEFLADIPSEVLLNRPDVVAAEQRLLAAHANVDAARSAFLPKIILTASLGVASSGLTSLFTGGAWSFQPLLAMPLFDAGRTAAGVDLASARMVGSVADYEKTIQIAFKEVADQLNIRTTLAHQFRAANAYKEAQERRLQIVQGRYDAGLVSYLDVLEAQRELLTAQQTISQMHRAQLEAAAQLYKTLGGGHQSADLESSTPSQ
jgi:multidrug efflux system outer membrane protein